MGTSVRSSPSIVVRELQVKPPKSQWLSLVLRRRSGVICLVDAFYAGDLIRACNLNPTLKTIKEIGGGCAKGEKFLSKPDVFPMYKNCKDSKDQGGFQDFVEILKLYDKNADDTILEFELFKRLVNLGEKLTKEEAKNLMKELCDPADDDGFIPFKPFLEKMCAAEK